MILCPYGMLKYQRIQTIGRTFDNAPLFRTDKKFSIDHNETFLECDTPLRVGDTSLARLRLRSSAMGNRTVRV